MSQPIFEPGTTRICLKNCFLSQLMPSDAREHLNKLKVPLLGKTSSYARLTSLHNDMLTKQTAFVLKTSKESNFTLSSTLLRTQGNYGANEKCSKFFVNYAKTYGNSFKILRTQNELNSRFVRSCLVLRRFPIKFSWITPTRSDKEIQRSSIL